jgi:hypothetical protein
MRKINALSIFLYFILFSFIIYADTPLNFLQNGNVFIYDAYYGSSDRLGSFNKDYITEKQIVADTVINDLLYKYVMDSYSNNLEFWFYDSTGFYIQDECFYYPNIKGDSSWIETEQTPTGLKQISITVKQTTEEWLGIETSVQTIRRTFWETSITSTFSEFFGALSYYYSSYSVMSDRRTWNGFKIKAAIMNDHIFGDTTITGIKKDNPAAPLEINLQQNYPNPFNSQTKITFSLSKEQFVLIEIFNSVGQKINQLLKKRMPAGSYQVTFNGNGLTSGIYFYKFTAGKFTQSKKMLLIK